MRYLIPLCCLLLPLTLAADEFDDLMKELEPPARFAEHQPQFSVSEQTFTFEAKDGQWNWKFSVVKDGDRFVAVVPHVGFHGGTIYLLTHDPAQAPTELPMPKERWHIDTAIGYSFRTDQFIPDKRGSKEWNQVVDGKQLDTTEWIVADDKATITLKRTFKGEHAFAKWEHNTRKKPIKVDHVGTFTLSCHPQLGYMITGVWETGLEGAKQRPQYVSLMPPGLSNPWPDAGVCQRVAICPVGQEGYLGWALNGVAVDKSGSGDNIRDGGFGVYLDEKSGWSNAMTLAGGNAKLSICNVHADLDYCVQWPADLPVGDDGLRRHRVEVRMVFFPPELTRHVLDEMKLKYTGGQVIIFPFGKVEDFEQQPYDLTTTERGMTFNASAKVDGKVTTAEAHSGEKSVIITGSMWPNIPQVVVRPGVKYRLSAWMKAEPMSEEQLAAYQAAHEAAVQKAKDGFPARLEAMKQKWAKQVERAKKKGREPPKEPTWPTEPKLPVYQEPGAFITGKLYQWSPHNARKDGSWAGEYKTNVAQPGDDWTEVSFEFTAPKWGPFIDIVFHNKGGGKAYLDDFSLVEVEE